jgi:hypothetical protein
MPRLIAFLVMLMILPLRAQAPSSAPSSELDAAYAKLRSLPSFRLKSYSPVAPERASVADVMNGISRTVLVIDGGADLGELRAETVASQTIEAKRFVSAGAATLIAQARAATTVAAARGIVSRILSAVQIVASGGAGALVVISEVQSGMMQVQSVVEARRFIDRVESLFQWDCRPIPGSRPGEMSVDVSAAGTSRVGSTDARKYLRRMRAGNDAVTVAVYVDVSTGLPLREEALDPQGRPQWVMEYIDLGAPIQFDVPACVK